MVQKVKKVNDVNKINKMNKVYKISKKAEWYFPIMENTIFYSKQCFFDEMKVFNIKEYKFLTKTIRVANKNNISF